MNAQRRYSHPGDRSTGVIFDQTLVLQGYQSAKDYPESFHGIARTEDLRSLRGQKAAFEDIVILRDLRERRDESSLTCENPRRAYPALPSIRGVQRIGTYTTTKIANPPSSAAAFIASPTGSHA